MLSLEINAVCDSFRYLKFRFIFSSRVFGVNLLLDIDISCSSPMDIYQQRCVRPTMSVVCLFGCSFNYLFSFVNWYSNVGWYLFGQLFDV